MPLFSQDSETDVFIIDNIEFKITGITRQFVILNSIDLKRNHEITGRERLETFINEKRWALNNQRVLQSSSIDYTIGELREDGKYSVSLLITTRDSWNFVPLPYPKFDSNSGIELTLKVRDYNFLGTMQPLRIDLGFRRDQTNRTWYNIMLETDFPFQLFNINWNFRFYNNIQYRPDMSRPWYFYHSLGLSVSIPFFGTSIGLGVSETLIANQEIDDYKHIYGDVHKGLFLVTNPYISWWIPTKLQIGKYGSLYYTISSSATFNHEFSQWPLPPNRIGPWWSISHQIGFGSVNWHGNFRNGLSVYLSNYYNYDFYTKNLGGQPFTYGVQAGLSAYKSYEEHFGIYFRTLYRQWFNTQNDSAGDVIRGIPNDHVSADIMLSFNFNLMMGVLKFRPSEWIKDTRFFRVFNFDFHLSPFFDLAIYRHRATELRYPDAHFTFKNMLLGGGLEIIVYSIFMRSLYLRASLGFNLSTRTGLGPRELYVGMELFF